MDWMAQWIGQVDGYLLGVATAAVALAAVALLLWLLLLRRAPTQDVQDLGPGLHYKVRSGEVAGVDPAEFKGGSAERIERCTGELRRLLAEADRRIQRLESLITAAANLGHAAASSSAAGQHETGQAAEQAERACPRPHVGLPQRVAVAAEAPLNKPPPAATAGELAGTPHPRAAAGEGLDRDASAGQPPDTADQKGPVPDADATGRPTGSIEDRFAHVYWLADTGHDPAEIATKTGLHRGEVELLLRLRRSRPEQEAPPTREA